MSFEFPRPEAVAMITDVMSTFRRPWALCGGWAIDGWLGRVTRNHIDVDITVFDDDQRALYEHLEGWHLAAHDIHLLDDGVGWDGRELELPAHLHGRPPGAENLALLKQWVNPPYRAPEDGLNLDVQFNWRSGDEWVLSDEPRLGVPWEGAVAQSTWGIPVVQPELLLFYKATAYHGNTKMNPRVHDEADFTALLPLLNEQQREWLGRAVSAAVPGHPWLSQPSQPAAKKGIG